MGLSGTSVPFEDRPVPSIYGSPATPAGPRRLGASESDAIRGLPHPALVLARGKYVTLSAQKAERFFALFE